MKTLNSKNILIVGASSQLGQLVFQELLDNNTNIILSSRRTSEIQSAIDSTSIPTKASVDVYPVDISDQNSINDLVKFVNNRFSKLDILINLSGIVSYKPIHELTNKEVDITIQTNLVGPILLLKSFLPLMQPSNYKVIAQIGSLAGARVGHKNFSIYSAAKEGLIGFFRSLVPELEPLGYKLLLIRPAGFNSKAPFNAIGANKLVEKFKKSKLDSISNVASGIVTAIQHPNLNSFEEKFMVFPTELSKSLYYGNK